MPSVPVILASPESIQVVIDGSSLQLATYTNTSLGTFNPGINMFKGTDASSLVSSYGDNGKLSGTAYINVVDRTNNQSAVVALPVNFMRE